MGVRSGIWALVSTVAALLVTAGPAVAQTAPQGCGYGTGGPNATTLCWLDMTAYNDAVARTAAGQPMVVTLPGGYTISFTVKSTGTPANSQRTVASRPLPTNGSASYIGSYGYLNIPGRPALYTNTGATATTTTLTLTDIQVRDAANRLVSGYAFVGADAENTNNVESITWTSDSPIYQVASLSPAPGANGCQNHVTGLGTTTVSCTGNPSPGGAYGTEIVAANSPTTFSQALYTGSGSNREGVAFALMTSKVELAKTVVGRVRGSDSFDLSVTSPEGSTIGSVSTGQGNTATTGTLTVLPRTNGSGYTLAEAATPASDTRVADYGQAWSCTNNGTPSPAGNGSAMDVAPAPGDDIRCTLTNTQLPADLAIVKTADPSPAVPGTTETYTLRVTNNGPSRATNVRVTDQLPPGVTAESTSAGCGQLGGMVTCSAGTLDAGDSRTFTVTTTISSAASGCAELTNTARVTSDTPDGDPSNDSASVCPPLRGVAGLSLRKTPSVTELPAGGGSVTYTLVVENLGPSDATGVRLADPMAAGLTLQSAQPSQGTCATSAGRLACALGTIAAGGSAQIIVRARTSSAPGPRVNTATVSGDQEDPDAADNTASATVVVGAPPAPPKPPAPPGAMDSFDLVVTKTASVRSASVGQAVRYTVTVANRGPAAAPGVRMTDTFDGRASLASARPSQGSCVREIPMVCRLGTIPAGGRATIAITVRPLRSGCRQRNAASAVGDGTDAAPAGDLATVDLCVRKVRLRVVKVADRSSVRAGGTVRFTIRVRNRTKGRANRVRVCDRLSAGMIYSGSRPRARLRGGLRCWTIDRLDAGRRRTFHLAARALRGAAGRAVNRVTVSSPDALTRHARRTIRVSDGSVLGGGVTG